MHDPTAAGVGVGATEGSAAGAGLAAGAAAAGVPAMLADLGSFASDLHDDGARAAKISSERVAVSAVVVGGRKVMRPLRWLDATGRRLAHLDVAHGRELRHLRSQRPDLGATKCVALAGLVFAGRTSEHRNPTASRPSLRVR